MKNEGIIIRRGCFARLVRYTLYVGLQIHGLLLSRASPSQLYVKRLTQRQSHTPSQIYIRIWSLSAWGHSLSGLPLHFARRTLIALAELQSGPLGRRRTSCEFAPWDIRWGHAGLLRLLAHAPTPSASTPPYQRGCSTHLAVGASHRTRLRAALALPLAQSVGQGALGPTQPPRLRGDRGFSSQTMSLRGHVPTRLTFPVALGGHGSTQTM